MIQTNLTRTINAPVDVVFKTVANIGEFSKAIPNIVKIEVLSDVKTGVGTRFRETRLMKGREATTELEITEYVENESVRLMADSHGTVWDTVFTVAAKDGATELKMIMDARPHKLMAKLTTPLMSGLIRKAIESDLDAVKAFCEKHA